MPSSQLEEFLTGAGDKPYRELVQYHIRRTSTKNLMAAGGGETELLPPYLRDLVIGYIDATNLRFGFDQQFWASATCRQAFDRIIEVAIEVLPLGEQILSVDDALQPPNHDLAFQLFQLPTLSFAYSASTQKAQRKFIGIRKGWFG